MGIDVSKLEKARRQGSKTIARCPACAEAGGDRKGEHLFINDEGQFGCVLHPGESGQAHRQRIFELAGVKEGLGKGFEVSKPFSAPPEPAVIQKDILGTLGTHIFKPRVMEPEEANRENNIKKQENSDKCVPSVPEPETWRPCLSPCPFPDEDEVWE